MNPGDKLIHHYYGEVTFLREDAETARPVVMLRNGVEVVVTNEFLKPIQANATHPPRPRGDAP